MASAPKISSPPCKLSPPTKPKNRFVELLDTAQRGPVLVTRHDSVVGAMVSAEDFEAMRRFYSDRLHDTLDAAADAAEQAGMTPEILEQLLADEN